MRTPLRSNLLATQLLRGTFFVALLAGCSSETVESSDIRTAGIHPIYSARANGNGKTVLTAELRVGGDDGTYVLLVDGDELVASADDASKVMSLADNGVQYQATLGIDAGGTSINVAFNREDSSDGNSDGPQSVVELPEPFELGLKGLEAGASIPRGSDVGVTWTPVGSGQMFWSLDGDCVFYASGTTADDGAFTISAEDIDGAGFEADASCDVTITLERTKQGTIDPAFKKEGGNIEATQERTIAFSSTPAPAT